MNRGQLVAKVADRTGLDPRMVEAVIVATLDTIAREVAAGGRVGLTGFGTFASREGAPRTARIPRMDRRLPLPARRRVVLRVGQRFQDLVEGRDDGLPVTHRTWTTRTPAQGHDKEEGTNG